MTVSKAFVQQTIQKNIKHFGNAFVLCPYVSYNNQSPEYDARDGIIVNDESVSFEVNTMIADFSFTKNKSGFKQISNEPILERDKKAIITALEFPTGIIPESDDKLTDPTDSITYFVVGSNLDPYKSVFLLHLRPIDG